MNCRTAAASAAVLLLSPLIVASDENSDGKWGWDRFHGVDLELGADKINNSEGSRLAALDEYFARSREEWNVPGMAIAIVKDDNVVFSKGYGVRDIEDALPVTNQTLFAIASNTKAFTATALAILVDEGKISWATRCRHISHTLSCTIHGCRSRCKFVTCSRIGVVLEPTAAICSGLEQRTVERML